MSNEEESKPIGQPGRELTPDPEPEQSSVRGRTTSNPAQSEDSWKNKLNGEQYRVMREGGTEMAFTGEYYHTKDEGTYACVGCGQKLFSSDTKFDSGTGWPSFDDALPGAVEFKEDIGHGMKRTEVVCSKCGGHLGHVFDDPSTGPGQAVLRQDGKPATKRYCINSVCLDLQKDNS